MKILASALALALISSTVAYAQTSPMAPAAAEKQKKEAAPIDPATGKPTSTGGNSNAGGSPGSSTGTGAAGSGTGGAAGGGSSEGGNPGGSGAGGSGGANGSGGGSGGASGN